MKLLKNLVLVVLVFILAYSLARKSPSPQTFFLPEAGGGISLSRDSVEPSEKSVSPEFVGGNPASLSEENIPSVQPGSMQIKNAFFSLLVKEVRQSVQEIASTASRLQGYVISSSVYEVGESGNLRGQVSFKVPQAKFEETLSSLRSLAVSVESETVTGQDVTEEFTDLSARLRNKEATEASLLELMKKSGSIADILEVQRELTQVREDIERLKGRLDYLEKNIAMSTVTVDLATEAEYLPLSQDKWRPLNIAKAALRTLITVVKTALNIVIWLFVFISPILLVLALPFILLLKFFRKKR
jgi:hypothetical protein